MESEIDRLFEHLHKSRYDNFPNLHSRGHEHTLAQFSTEIGISGQITGISVSLCTYRTKQVSCTYKPIEIKPCKKPIVC